jgi:hypothetical protein
VPPRPIDRIRQALRRATIVGACVAALTLAHSVVDAQSRPAESGGVTADGAPTVDHRDTYAPRVTPSQRRQLFQCAARERRVRPALAGRVDVRLRIAARTGRVLLAEVLQSTLHNPTVEACLVRSFRRMRFAPPREDHESVVPVVFAAVD